MGFGPLDIAVFLIVLGVLVFVHELGHFLAAKACNIYVDRFSLGMPPRLFGFKIGETDYCVGLLPIGGYVKMAGQEDAPMTDEEREQTYGHVPPERWYNNKPVWQRAIVLVAGPLMNVVLAVLIYAFIAGYGRNVPVAEVSTRVGEVETGSPASKAPLYQVQPDSVPDFDRKPDAVGWQTGDTIVTINGKHVNGFQDIAVAAILGGGKQAIVQIDRPEPDGAELTYLSPITAQHMDQDEEVRSFGIAPFSPALISHVFPGSPAEEGGIEPGDIILRADDKVVDQATFSKMVREQPPGKTINLLIERDGEEKHLTLKTRQEGSFEGIGFSPPLRSVLALLDKANAEVVENDDSAFLQQVRLRPGDTVIKVNDSDNVGATLRKLVDDDPSQSVQAVVKTPSGVFESPETKTVALRADELVRALTGVDPESRPDVAWVSPEVAEKTGIQRKDRIIEIDGQPATVRRMRDLERTKIGQTVPVKVEQPAYLGGLYQKRETFETKLNIESIQQIGVVFGTKTVFKRERPADILPWAFKESFRQVQRIGAVISRLLTGGLSPKLLGGPVMIGDVVTTAYRVGFFYLLDITAMISVNLAVFNLLPLPVLDGGQLVFLGIEAIRRRPVSTRVMEAVQQVGFLFIIGLLIYVTFNDVSRIVQRLLP